MRDQSNSKGRVAHKPRRLHLLYHELRPSRSDYLYALDTATFAQHLRLFTEFLNFTQKNAFTPVVTFDDGHLSDYTQALPLLDAHGIKAHFFITAGWTGIKSGYMGWREIKDLHAAGHRIGAHGWSHALLHHCTPSQWQTELNHTRQVLEDRLGTSLTTMSLPGGRHNAQVLEACKNAGYTTIYTSIPRAEEDPLGFTVGRVNIRGDVTLDWLSRLLQPESELLSKMERQYRIKAAAKRWLGDRLYERIWAILNRRGPDAEEGEAAGE